MRSPKPLTGISVEILYIAQGSMKITSFAYLVELDVVFEMNIQIQPLTAAVCSTETIAITAKDMDNAVLDLLRNFTQVHVVTAAGWTFDLQL